MKVKVNLDEVLYQKIIECLIRGEYAVGEKIMLQDLCDKFEVSRTPVVQAVKMLNKDGILNIMTNGRVYVPEFEEVTVEQIIEVRMLLEEYALRKLMEKDAETIHSVAQELQRCAEKGKAYFEKKQYVELAMADLEFHKTLLRGAENKIMNDLYTGVQGRFIVLNYLIRPLKSRNYEMTVLDHFELVEMMMNQQSDRALAKLRKHINAAGVPEETE